MPCQPLLLSCGPQNLKTMHAGCLVHVVPTPDFIMRSSKLEDDACRRPCWSMTSS